MTIPTNGGRSAQVAVVIRTKNRPVFLRRALNDLLRQTFTDWTAVIVNDGGDKSALDELLNEFDTRFDTRLTVIHNEFSHGMEAASNEGVAASSSRYLSIHDDDDSWHPDFLRRTTARLEQGPERAVMVRTEIVHEKMMGQSLVEESRELYAPEIQAITMSDMLRSNQGVPISCLYDRALHEEIGLYDASLPVVGDWEFYLRVLTATPIAFIDEEPLAFYHQRPAGSHGTAGNTVNEKRDLHASYDKLIRDRYLQEEVRAHGYGASLYWASRLGTETSALNEHIRRAAEYLIDQQKGLSARIQDLEKQQTEVLDQLAELAVTLERTRQDVAHYSTGAFLRRLLRIPRRR